MEKIGALWLKESNKGNKYLTGTVNGKRVVVFKNTKKKSDKSPDYQIFLSGQKEQQESFDNEPDFLI